MIHSLCSSYSVYQHLPMVAEKEKKQPPTGVGPALMTTPQCSPVEHKQSHKTSTSDKATL